MSQTLAGPHFITTAPTLTVCSICRRPVLAATVGGLDRHIDPVALDDAGELAALLEGRRTFQLRRRLLTRRTVHHIAAGRPARVVAEHTCSTPAGADLEVLAEAGLHEPVLPVDRCPF